MKKTKILLTILLAAALFGALALVKNNQNLQKGATFANTTLSVLPNSKITKNVGETLSVQVVFQTESGAKVDGVQTKVCYGNQLSLDQTSGAVGNVSAGFDESPIISVSAGADQSCAIVVATSKKDATNLTTTANAVTLNFSALSGGSGSITIDQNGSMVTGDNPASTTDKTLAITSVSGTTYEIIGGVVITGNEPILNYKVAYANVKANDAACVINWPMQVIVLGGGESKVYSNVVPSSAAAVGNVLVESGSLALTGFNHFDHLAVFFKGPKHLQMKYAVQNQDGPYNTAGGELVLTNNSSSPVYDFTGYPMIPGDVTGATDGVQDGWIDGIDFSYVKTRALTHDTVSSGSYLLSDLDGNCQVNSNDVNVLKISLQTKQGQLY
jgi:hypothetical protein